MVFVTWKDAHAYATWAGKELPTSEQWEKAARGPRGDVYPWGQPAHPGQVQQPGDGHRTDHAVSRYHSGVSPYGIYDLCGNTWEWCSSQSGPGRYELKAGAFTSPFSRVKPSAFNDADAGMLDDDTGFRCCVTNEAMAANQSV